MEHIKDAEQYMLKTGIIYRSESDARVRVNTTRDTGVASTEKLVHDVQKFADQFAAAFAQWYTERLHIYADGGPELALEDFKRDIR